MTKRYNKAVLGDLATSGVRDRSRVPPTPNW